MSSFLLDDSLEDTDEMYTNDHPGDDEQTDYGHDFEIDSSEYSYDILRDLDPVAAGRIHPNNQRKINQYLDLYSRTGILPSEVYQGKAAEGRTGVKLVILGIIAVLYVLMLPTPSWIDTWDTE